MAFMNTDLDIEGRLAEFVDPPKQPVVRRIGSSEVVKARHRHRKPARSEAAAERHRWVVWDLVERCCDLVDGEAELKCSHRLDVEAVELRGGATEQLMEMGRIPVVEDMA